MHGYVTDLVVTFRYLERRGGADDGLPQVRRCPMKQKLLRRRRWRYGAAVAFQRPVNGGGSGGDRGAGGTVAVPRPGAPAVG